MTVPNQSWMMDLTIDSFLFNLSTQSGGGAKSKKSGGGGDKGDERKHHSVVAGENIRHLPGFHRVCKVKPKSKYDILGEEFAAEFQKQKEKHREEIHRHKLEIQEQKRKEAVAMYGLAH